MQDVNHGAELVLDLRYAAVEIIAGAFDVNGEWQIEFLPGYGVDEVVGLFGSGSLKAEEMIGTHKETGGFRSMVINIEGGIAEIGTLGSFHYHEIHGVRVKKVEVNATVMCRDIYTLDWKFCAVEMMGRVGRPCHGDIRCHAYRHDGDGIDDYAYFLVGKLHLSLSVLNGIGHGSGRTASVAHGKNNGCATAHNVASCVEHRDG